MIHDVLCVPILEIKRILRPSTYAYECCNPTCNSWHRKLCQQPLVKNMGLPLHPRRTISFCGAVSKAQRYLEFLTKNVPALAVVLRWWCQSPFEPGDIRGKPEASSRWRWFLDFSWYPRFCTLSWYLGFWYPSFCCNHCGFSWFLGIQDLEGL